MRRSVEPGVVTMASTIENTDWTIADLMQRFGPMPLARICQSPPPGRGTEQDVLEWESRENRLFELVDTVLLEKTLGFYEAYLASLLVTHLTNFVQQNQLGIVTGADGMMRLAPGIVRIPDVAFLSWDRLPDRQVPREPLPSVVPDLAVEILSTSNTQQEMQGKLRDYFAAGVRLVWYVDPPAKCVQVYRDVDTAEIVEAPQTIAGGEVLPGFALSLADFFRQPRRE